MRLFAKWRRRRSISANVVPLRRADIAAALPTRAAFQHIDDVVDELIRAGALDEGNKRAFDGSIASWRAQHQELLTAFHLDMTGSREKRIQTLNARIEVARKRLASSERLLATLADGRNEDERVGR